MSLDHLSVYAICAKIILVNVPYALRDDDQNNEILAAYVLCGESHNNENLAAYAKYSKMLDVHIPLALSL